MEKQCKRDPTCLISTTVEKKQLLLSQPISDLLFPDSSLGSNISHNPVDRVLILLDAFDIAPAREYYSQNTETTNERVFVSIIGMNKVV